MSPTIARAAATAAARRPSSIIMKIRSMGRAMEHHPYERLPVTQSSAKPDWVNEIKWVSGKVLMYIPTFGLLLGWPVIAEAVMDGHV